VALNDTAVKVQRRQAEKHPQFVFTYFGCPVGQVNTKAWKNALRRTGIEDFHSHGLRHTWMSWLTQSGGPLNALREMGRGNRRR
jgi:integrase